LPKSDHLRREVLPYRKGLLRMTTMPPSLDPASPEFQARRAEARKALDAIDPAMRGDMAVDSKRQQWFETVYSKAEDDPARVPWANLSAHPLTEAFVKGQIRGIDGLRVLDIGCGLGDNAECFAAAGAKVTAFDFVAQAVEWAKRRFPHSTVDYRVADLFALPEEWRGGFDLVHECYTLQAISEPLIPQAFGILASLLAPGGKLLLVARARSEDEEVSGPPWPLPPSFIEQAKNQGLAPVMIEDISATAQVGRRHWRVLLCGKPHS
jgi:SAM-dependent methyltransferase